MISSFETAPVNTCTDNECADLMSVTFLEREPTKLYIYEPMLIIGDSIGTKYLADMKKHIVVEHAGGVQFIHLFISSNLFTKGKMVLIASKPSTYPAIRYIDALTMVLGYDTTNNMYNVASINKVMLDLYFMYNDNYALKRYIERNPMVARYIGSTICSDINVIMTMLHDHASINYDNTETPELDLLGAINLPPYSIMEKSFVFNIAMNRKPFVTDINKFKSLARKTVSNDGADGYIPYEARSSVVSENLSPIMDLLCISDVDRECVLNTSPVTEFVNNIGMESTGDIYIKPMDFMCMDSSKGPVLFDLCTVNLLMPCIINQSQLQDVLQHT